MYGEDAELVVHGPVKSGASNNVPVGQLKIGLVAAPLRMRIAALLGFVTEIFSGAPGADQQPDATYSG